MKTVRQILAMSVAAITMATASGVAVAQAVAPTPLTQPIQTQGSVTPSQPSACGFLAPSATQVLEVREDFAAVNVNVSGSAGMTLFIEGPNGFRECHTTNGSAGTVNAPGLLNRGRYSFYVGNTNPVATTYQLTISQD